MRWTARLLLVAVGWLMITVGTVMLVIPGPGVLTILFGAAVLSVVSPHVHRLLRRLLRRWPKVWARLQLFRRRVRAWLGDDRSL